LVLAYKGRIYFWQLYYLNTWSAI